jgi:hypothetical protein
MESMVLMEIMKITAEAEKRRRKGGVPPAGGDDHAERGGVREVHSAVAFC